MSESLKIGWLSWRDSSVRYLFSDVNPVCNGLSSEQLSNPGSQISQSMRGSRNHKGKQITATDPSVKSPFCRVSRVNTLDSLPEGDEPENVGFVALYDPCKGSVNSYKEGDTPKFFGESSAFTFPQVLKGGNWTVPTHSGRRPEFWTIPSVSSRSRAIRLVLFDPLPVAIFHPKRTPDVSCIPGTEFDASPPGHVLRYSQHYLANSTPADLRALVRRRVARTERSLWGGGTPDVCDRVSPF